MQGRIQDFKFGGGGGGGGAFKNIAPNGGRRENVWGISCEKSRFFPILGGGGAGCAPPGSAPDMMSVY